MKTLVLSDYEAEHVRQSLEMRMAFIETGNVCLRAIDVAERRDDGVDGPAELNPLSVSQMKLIITLDELVNKLR
jgi:hypothetical protein